MVFAQIRKLPYFYFSTNQQIFLVLFLFFVRSLLKIEHKMCSDSNPTFHIVYEVFSEKYPEYILINQVIFLKISWQKGKITCCHVFVYYFFCLIMSKVKSIEKHKVLFLTNIFLECVCDTVFPNHLHPVLILLILEFSIQRKLFQMVVFVLHFSSFSPTHLCLCHYLIILLILTLRRKFHLLCSYQLIIQSETKCSLCRKYNF